jgi:3-isopropylmalate/(R)-2-methylmalate dehydratase small subunit
VEQIAAGFADGTPVTIDMPSCEVRMGLAVFPFSMEDEARTMLIEGADAIELTLRHRAEIEGFFARDAAVRPWIYLAD